MLLAKDVVWLDSLKTISEGFLEKYVEIVVRAVISIATTLRLISGDACLCF